MFRNKYQVSDSLGASEPSSQKSVSLLTYSQGAGAVELFSAKGSDPVGKWKLSGTSTSIRREYNKELRGLVYCLEGGCQAVKMQMPANEKMSLGLVQQFLVLQVNVPKDKDFSIELVVTDKTQLKRRLYLSTVHKELSTTLWHARIPFVGLKRDVWSTLFIDLVSFTGNLFKDAGFSSLDGISVSATCSVRRIFTVHPELKGAANHGALFREAALADAIPRSCRLPSDLDPQPQIWSMETLVERVAEKSTSARSAGHQKTKPQGFLRKTPGCRATRTSTPSGRRSHAHGEDRDEVQKTGRLVACQKEGANTAEVESVSQSFVHLEHEGAARSVQSQLPKDRQPGKQASVENMKVASPGCLRRGSCGAEKMGEPSSPTTNRKVSSVLTPSEKMKPATINPSHCSFVAFPPAEHLSGWNRRGPSSDPWVRSGWDSIDEPEFTLQDEAFAFKSQPHSPKRRQGRGDQEQTEGADECASDYSGRRFEASPEDDFVSSEADEDEPNAEFRDQVINVRPSTTTSEMKYTSGSEAPFTSQDLCEERLAVPEDVRVAGRGGAGSDVMVPKRCFSPCNGAEEPKSCHRAKHSLEGSRSVRLSRRILKEARAEDLKRQQGADSTPGSSDFRGRSLLLSRSDECDAEEMRMLASLRREQEEDENQASGLSASQIHQCHVSMSMSSDDNSTWTHISMPANQGCHYQNEMTPPERSDPRQWMDVLSPPLIPPTPERSDSSGKLIEHPSSPAGGDAPVNDGDECLNLLYDSCLNCYFDPLTGKYYELA
ncbi:LOW QUALITY PROTEIN: protein CFAP20DC [Neosynchiropus ocellatus]